MSSPMVSPTSSAGVPPPEFILDMPPDLGIDNIVMPPDSPMGDLPVMPMDLDDVPIPLVPSPPPPQAMAQADTFEETEDTLMKSSEGMPSSPAAASTTTVDGEVSDTEDSLANEALVQALHIACASARRLVRTPGQRKLLFYFIFFLNGPFSFLQTRLSSFKSCDLWTRCRLRLLLLSPPSCSLSSTKPGDSSGVGLWPHCSESFLGRPDNA